MTDRIPLDHLTSDALDALYERLEAAEETESQRQLATAREALASATTRAARAEAAIARVRALADLIGSGTATWTGNEESIAHRIHAALDEPVPDPAATQATDGTTCCGKPGGAVCVHDLTPKEQPTPTITTGLVVQPYRNDRGESAWVFRCWGTDTCDGWLSLDHTSEQSAQRARDRHIADEHKEQPGA